MVDDFTNGTPTGDTSLKWLKVTVSSVLVIREFSVSTLLVGISLEVKMIVLLNSGGYFLNSSLRQLLDYEYFSLL